MSEDLQGVPRRLRVGLALATLLVGASYIALELGPGRAPRLFDALGALGVAGLVAAVAGLAATHPARRFHVMAALAALALPVRTLVDLATGLGPNLVRPEWVSRLMTTLDFGLVPGLVAAMAVAILRPSRAGTWLAALVLALALVGGLLFAAPWTFETPLGLLHAHHVGRALRSLSLATLLLTTLARPPRAGLPPALEPAAWVHALRGCAPIAIGQALLLATPLLVLIGPLVSVHGDGDVGLHTVARIVQALGLGCSGLGFLWLAALPRLASRARLAAAAASALVTAAWALIGGLHQLSDMAGTTFGAAGDASALPFIGFLPGAGWVLAQALFGLALMDRMGLRPLALTLVAGAAVSAALAAATQLLASRLGVLHLLLLATQAALAGLVWVMAARARRAVQAAALVTSFSDDPPGA